MIYGKPLTSLHGFGAIWFAAVGCAPYSDGKRIGYPVIDTRSSLTSVRLSSPDGSIR